MRCWNQAFRVGGLFMGAFRVVGKTPITGEITPSGNKNEALPVLAASILASSPVSLDRIPRIGDILTMIKILQNLGAELHWSDDNKLELDPTQIGHTDPDQQACASIRASFLLAGPLLAKRGHLKLPNPGGDHIGRRRLDSHFLALQALGANIVVDGAYHLTAPKGLRGAEVFLDEASVMATENALMAACAAVGRSVIYNAACEPHVQGLCRFLCGLGAKIEGIGSNVLSVHGSQNLKGCSHRVMSDHIETGSFIGLAAVCGGQLTIRDIEPENLRMIRMVFRRLGVQTQIHDATLTIPAHQSLEVQKDLGGSIPRIDDAPWPGFPADLTSIALVAATQCQGTVVIHEKMFESRLFFVDGLIAMGAGIVLCDPHRAVVIGPAELYARELSSPDIRAGMAMLIAALKANGTSIIHNIRQIDRGYENIDVRLNALGAKIERIAD